MRLAAAWGFATLLILTGAQPAGAFVGVAAASPDLHACDGISGLTLAPTLKTSPDLAQDGSPVTISPGQGGGYVAVLMVHGWTGRSEHTDLRDGDFSHLIDLTANSLGKAEVSRSLIGQLQDLPGAAVYTYDYHDYSARWVDDSHVGGGLGEAIDCLYAATGEQVIVVAHSMGGLAARWALARPSASSTPRTAEVSTVVTFGTPNTGSDLASFLGGSMDAATTSFPLLRTLLSACGSVATEKLDSGSLCDSLLPYAPVRAFDSEAGTALRAGSPQLADLPPWPGSVNVYALAGEVVFEVPHAGWFFATPYTTEVPVGDVVVGRGSAIDGAGSSDTVTCTYQLNVVRGTLDEVGVALQLTAANDVAGWPFDAAQGACFHGNLMRSIELTNDALGAVFDQIQATFAASGSLDISQWDLRMDGVGPFTVGESFADLTAYTGNDYLSDSDSLSVVGVASFPLAESGPLSNVAVEYTGGNDHAVGALWVRSADGSALPKTREGVGVGSTLEELRGAYGDALANPGDNCSGAPVWWVTDGTLAMSFWMGDDGRVSGVGVGDPFEVAYKACE